MTKINLQKLNKDFYETLDYIIEMQGLTRSRICIMLGKSSSTLNKSKKQGEKLSWFSIGLFFEILNLLNCDPTFFFELMKAKYQRK